MTRALLLFVLLFAAAPALAHKVIASVFASGNMIEGEIGLSNGEMASNQPVEVFDGEGNRLGETITDEDGFFVFAPEQPVAHRFYSDLGAGHVANITMPADEVAAILGVAAEEPVATKPNAVAKGTVAVASLSDEERAVIATIVRDETRSLRREIAAYKEKNDLQTILGGIGYIFGLFGLGFYLAARRKLKLAG
ncbi:cobalt ABC transporter permease [Primorskyibacter sp. S87]|uniref:cobalt ABC transporter permease n=1 Tax=Primorskyibacter sp. S87 TaxID=3415126 RepID=UPI003C7EC1E1